MSADLIAWLRAQLDADERIAGQAGADDPTWAYDRETFTVSSRGGWSIAARKDNGSPINDVDGEHIARVDPARVLAEVEAKRRIIDWCEQALRTLDGVEVHSVDPRDVLGLLALPYADRPGYQESWRP